MENEVITNNRKFGKKAFALGLSAFLQLFFILINLNPVKLFKPGLLIGVIITSLLVLVFIVVNHYTKILKKGSKVFCQVADTFVTLNVILLVFQLFFAFLYYPTYVDGNSMVPNLRNEDKLIVQARKKPERGDIVVFLPTLNNIEAGELFVKRVVGVPGDSFYFDDDGYLYLNGVLYKEEYLLDSNGKFTALTLTDAFEFEGTIPEGYYFLMGDNRQNSYDSRAFGLIHEDKIYGVVKYKRMFLRLEKVK